MADTVYRNILVAVDGSSGSKKALHQAILLAREARATVHALAVEDHLPRFAATIDEVDETRQELDAFYAGVMEEAGQIGREYDVPVKAQVTTGHAAKTIVQRAEQIGADLIVIGHSGHSGVWGNFLGTTADKVSRHAACDVLIVR